MIGAWAHPESAASCVIGRSVRRSLAARSPARRAAAARCPLRSGPSNRSLTVLPPRGSAQRGDRRTRRSHRLWRQPTPGAGVRRRHPGDHRRRTRLTSSPPHDDAGVVTREAKRSLLRIELAWAGCIVANMVEEVALAVYAFDAGGVGAVGVATLVRSLPAGLLA